jgi:hypothetical protein
LTGSQKVAGSNPAGSTRRKEVKPLIIYREDFVEEWRRRHAAGIKKAIARKRLLARGKNPMVLS